MKLINAIKKYLLRDTEYFFKYITHYFGSGYIHSASFYDDRGLFEQIAKGKSLIRLGDGEIGLLHYLPIHYQIFSTDIRNDFLKLIKEYTNKSNYIIGIPKFVNSTNGELRADKIRTFQCWMPLKVSYEMFFNKEATYFDQHVFYRDGRFERILLPYLLTKKIILVTNQKNAEEIASGSFGKHIYDTVLSPSINAYESREEIKAGIISAIKKTGLPKNDFAIIMAAGLSKTIIHDLSEDGYQLFDIGRGLEAYYKNISIEYCI